MFISILKKFKEAAMGVIPITLILLIVNFTVSPMSTGNLISFLIGALLLVAGLTLYNFGCGSSIEFIGGQTGAHVSKSSKLPLILALCGIIGFVVTVAEPDLSVLAEQVSGIDNFLLIAAVALGVGIFVVIAVMRLVLKIELKWILLFFYALLFVLAFILPRKFVPIAFDSSGVTTGPVTVPFIMALGASLSVALGGKDSQDSSFGILGICSIGPIFAVMILSLVCNLSVDTSQTETIVINTFGDVLTNYAVNFPKYLKEMAIAIAPITIFFLVYNFTSLKLSWKRLIRTLFNMLYVYIGLSIFLLGANVGFVPAGKHFGEALVTSPALLVAIGALLGAVIVLAEPAVHVLTKQVEDVTGGTIKNRTILVIMCFSMALAIGLSMLRIIFDIDLRGVLLAGYGIALGLMFLVPKIFTGIAFDSGGVASGAMTAAFLLPLANGATYALYGSSENLSSYIMNDAFGVVALVAMTPLVTIQVLGLVYKLRSSALERERTEEFSALLAYEGEVIDISETTLETEERLLDKIRQRRNDRIDKIKQKKNERIDKIKQKKNNKKNEGGN